MIAMPTAEAAPPPAPTEERESDRDTRLTLAFLWVWVLFNYVYGDILHIFMIFMSPATQAELEAGSLGGMQLDKGTQLAMAAGMQLSIMMTFLAWKLPRRLNRPLNIAIGALFTLIMAAILVVSARRFDGYALYAAIEVAITAAIVRIAWTWTPAETVS